MYNYYLYGPSFTHSKVAALEESLKCLNDLAVDNKDVLDTFLKHNTLWDIEVEGGTLGDIIFSNLSDKHFAYIVLPRLLESIKDIDTEIRTIADFDKDYTLYNAFYGIDFVSYPHISRERYIIDKDDYDEFRRRNLCAITPSTLWDRQTLLFKKIILCGDVKGNLLEIGDTYLQQIFKRLTELDRYVSQNWTVKKPFDYREVNSKSSLNISPESKSTMKKNELAQRRTFSLPDGRRECFELHIKTGDLRFHFYPEANMIYVGYIGKHLPTSQEK